MADQITLLVQRQSRARDRIDASLFRTITRLLAAMLGGGAWYDPTRQATFQRDASAAVRTAQESLAGITSAYLDRVMVDLGERQSNRPFVLPPQIRNVDPLTEWQRPAVQYRYAVSQGASPAEAQQAATLRAITLADDDVTLAQSKATTIRLADYPKVTGYRRVIHPELSKGGTCGLCAVASDRVYKVDRLMPVHDRCKCGILPVTVAHDPGSALNTTDLQRLYDQVGSTFADDLKRARFTVEDHSELGPQLLAA